MKGGKEERRKRRKTKEIRGLERKSRKEEGKGASKGLKRH